MDRLIYTSLTAMRGSMARQTAIANNLANAQTPGFRADMAEAQSLWLNGSGYDSRALSSEEVLGADMKAGTVVETVGNGPVHVTVSIGVAVAGNEDRDIADVIERADRGLYRAKHGGRNAVVAETEPVRASQVA